MRSLHWVLKARPEEYLHWLKYAEPGPVQFRAERSKQRVAGANLSFDVRGSNTREHDVMSKLGFFRTGVPIHGKQFQAVMTALVPTCREMERQSGYSAERAARAPRGTEV